MSTPTKNNFSAAQVQHVAKLANIPITANEAAQLSTAFSTTLDYIDNLRQLDTTQTQPTHQVTGLENVWREDVVDEAHMYSQAQALANAPRSHQGYFVVPQVIDKDA